MWFSRVEENVSGKVELSIYAGHVGRWAEGAGITGLHAWEPQVTKAVVAVVHVVACLNRKVHGHTITVRYGAMPEKTSIRRLGEGFPQANSFQLRL